MTLFTRLATALNAKGARLDFEMVAMGDDQLRVRVTPNLGECPDNATDEERQLRALLGAPLTISGSAEDIDAALAERLQERMEIQTQGVNALDALREKMASATAAAEKAKPSKAGTSKPQAKKATTPAVDDEEENEPTKVSRNDTDTPTLDNF